VFRSTYREPCKPWCQVVAIRDSFHVVDVVSRPKIEDYLSKDNGKASPEQERNYRETKRIRRTRTVELTYSQLKLSA